MHSASDSREALPEVERPSCRLHTCEGLTLVEMLVAIVIIGVIFSAAASALISLTRASVHNERRVQATAIMTVLHERFQAIPWQDAAIYEDDVPDLADAGLGPVVSGTVSTVGAYELATIESDCEDFFAEDCTLVPQVPRARSIVEQDSQEYTVFQAVTWVDRDGASPGTIKRLITVVEWEVFGQSRSQSLDSDRAAVSSDLDPNPVQTPTFDPLPSQVQLDASGRNDQVMSFEAVFPDSILPSVTDVRVVFEILDDEDLIIVQELSLTPELLNPRIFRASIARASFRFEADTQLIRLEWDESAESRFLDVPQTFLEFGGEAEVSPTVGTVTNVQVSPVGDIFIGRFPPSANQLCQDLTLLVTVQDVDPVNERVVARFNPSTGTGLEVLRLLEGSTNVYVADWDEESISPWLPPDGGGSSITDEFRVRVESRVTTAASEAELSSEIVFRRVAGSNDHC